MSDDIVTRLRGEFLARWVMTSDELPILREAVDEIERLRQLADNLYKTLQYYPCQCGISPCKCGYDDMMDEYKEVRSELGEKTND